MKAERFRQIEAVFHASLERDPAEREAFLTGACSGDDELRHEVDSLLAEHEKSRNSLENAASELAKEWSGKTSNILGAGSILGKYQIERLLGEGGMGQVFLAYDSTLRRQLAIKVLRSPAADDSSHSQLLREARSASALNHPNICTIYEVGEEGEWAFIAMEYIDGRPLSDVVDAGLTTHDAVHYGIEAADALAHAHERGVVHRDLKAGNAIVSGGRLKIIDFGLARRTDALDPEATAETRQPVAAAGTPYAMAPEQVRRENADARTDIWALGVLLYEMLTGGKPFKGTSTAELFASILRDRPAPLPVEVPGSLRGLVERCLDKDPNARYQRAADVRSVLEAAAVLQRGRPKSDPHIAAGGALPPAPMLNTVGDPGGFVGRENELALMLNVWTRATGGNRQLMLLAGEPGIGKTRLALEFGRRRASEGATVLAGRSDEEALVPYQPFVEALNWYARVCPEPELRGQLAAIGGGAELGQMIPELMRRITDLPVLQPMNAEGQRYRLFEAVAALLAQASASRPMVVILDDLHWADKPTLLMLRHVVRSSDAANFCVVGTYRESELARTHPLAEMLVDLRREQMVTRMSLRGLDAPETRVLVNTLAGPDLPPRLASLVMDSTDGNPFFIAEMLKHLSETGALARLRGAHAFGASDLGLPEGIKEVIGRRLSRLSEECNRILSLAAVIGRDFDLDLLLKLADLAEDRILDAVDEAIEARLICEVPGRPQRFTFLHALIRETLYGELTSTRRVRLHRRVGEAIEQLAEGSPTPPLADLAYHFAQAAPAGAADKAIDYATRAGDRAADAVALEEAARLYDIALQSLEFKTAGPEAEHRYVDLHERRARAFGGLGQWALQKREVEEALRYLNAQQVDRRAELCLELAEASLFLFDIPSVEKASTEALNLSERVDRPDIAADAIGWLARVRQANGDLPGAIELDRSAMAKGKGIKNIALVYCPLTLYLAGETTEAVSWATKVVDFARSSRDPGSVMYSLSHCGLSLGAAGRYDEAAKIFEEVRQFGKKYRVLPLLARATSMSVGFHLNVFDFEGAEALVSEARELAASVNFDPTLVSASIDLILIHARRHEPERAEKLLRETTPRMENTRGWHEWLWQLRMTQARAELALARGDFEAAVVEAEHGSALSRSKRRPKYEALGLITAAHALNSLGHTHQAIEKARSAIAAARPTADPALLLQAADALLTLDGNDPLADEARGLTNRILAALPNETMKSRFTNSEVVHRIRRL